MEIKIIETGEIEELVLIDRESGVNWVRDLMGNHNALPDRSDDGDYLMGVEDYEWWQDLTRDYQAADDRYHDLLKTLNDDDYDRLLDDAQNISVDLEDFPGTLNRVCDDYEEGKE